MALVPLSVPTEKNYKRHAQKNPHAVERGGGGNVWLCVLTICRRIFASDYFFCPHHLNRDTRNRERLTLERNITLVQVALAQRLLTLLNSCL